MSSNVSDATKHVVLIEKGLNKATLKGSFDLNECFVLKTSCNTLNELLTKTEDKGVLGVKNLNFDPVLRCLELMEKGLKKGNVNGCFELEESYVLKVSIDGIKGWVTELTEEIKNFKTHPTKKPLEKLPKIEEVKVELSSDSDSDSSDEDEENELD